MTFSRDICMTFSLLVLPMTILYVVLSSTRYWPKQELCRVSIPSNICSPPPSPQSDNGCHLRYNHHLLTSHNHNLRILSGWACQLYVFSLLTHQMPICNCRLFVH